MKKCDIKEHHCPFCKSHWSFAYEKVWYCGKCGTLYMEELNEMYTTEKMRKKIDKKVNAYIKPVKLI
jgi:ribosomal protein L37AE/L43A